MKNLASNPVKRSKLHDNTLPLPLFSWRTGRITNSLPHLWLPRRSQTADEVGKEPLHILSRLCRGLHKLATESASKLQPFLLGDLPFVRLVAFIADKHKDWFGSFYSEHRLAKNLKSLEG